MDIFTCDRVGTYSFTGFVKHRVVLTLPALSRLRRHGVVNVAAHSPDGGTINDPALHVALQLRTRSHGHWLTVGTASVADSRAAVRYQIPTHVPRGQVVVRALASVASYFPQSSNARTVRF
jgi:hypothetical protein